MKLGFCIKNKTEKKAGIVLNHGMNKDLNGAECLWRIQANTLPRTTHALPHFHKLLIYTFF